MMNQGEQVKERPILFQGAMVRALLAGTKTQTRRVVKGVALDWLHPDGFTPEFVAHRENGLCPYGKPGDRLVVRETWQYYDWTEDGYPFVRYAADNASVLHEHFSEDWAERLQDVWVDLSSVENLTIDNRARDRRWRPSIHMPRWASRILLEITEVRVERLQSISEADARAEGCVSDVEGDAADHYASLWDSINGKRPGMAWADNPWVCAVSFRKLASPGDEGERL